MTDTKWSKLQKEYVTTDISYRDLAKKHKVSQNSLFDYAKKHQWVKLREEYQNEITIKTLQKASDLISDNYAAVASNLSEIARLASEKLLVIFQSDEPMKSHHMYNYMSVWKMLNDALPKEENAEAITGGVAWMPEQTEGE